MAVRFSEIWLRIGVVFVAQLPVTRGQLCPPGWTFHSLTGSCMTVIRENRTHIDARSYCEYYSGSNMTKGEGHLVFILDKATDDFVKGLLDVQGVDRALIGLHDRVRNGDYVWDNNSTIPINYTGWADNPHTPDYYKSAVVTNKDGWQEYDSNSKAYFVCQENAATLPDIQCSHTFVQEMVRTTCTASQVYPQVYCTWKVNYLKRPIAVYDQTVSNVANTDGYYRATCNVSFYVNNAGTYDVTVTMALTLPNPRIETVKETSVSVAPPQQPPQLYHAGKILQTYWVEVVENQTLTLTCHVPGGDPPVYRTIITCNNIPQLFVSDGSSVTVDVRVTREFNGRSCTCSALHAARYTQTASVGVWVTYPATVTSFWIARRSSTTSVRRGDEIKFSCEATGNPMSQLTVQRQNGPTLTNSSTGDTTYQKTASCSDMGSYLCLASNKIQGQHHKDSQVVHLEVRCAPEHCSGTSSSMVPAAVGTTSASIKICVRAYPAPTSFSLYKGNTTSHRLKEDTFQAYFNFTKEEDGLGEITVMIYPFTHADIGDYILYSEYRPYGVPELYSYLPLSLFAQGTHQFKDPPSLSLVYKGQVNGAVSINVPVFGYPEPTVTLSSTKHILPFDAYTLNYTQLEPPYGTVLLVINIQNARFFQNYTLSIINTGGPLTYSFEIVESDLVIPVSENGGSPAQFVGALVGGIVAAVHVIVIICVIIFLLKRKGAPCNRKKHQNANTSKQAIYEHDEPGSHDAVEDVPEAPEDPHYLEIIDFRSDISDNNVHYSHHAPEDPDYLEIIDAVYDMPNHPVHFPNHNYLTARYEDVGYDNPANSL